MPSNEELVRQAYRYYKGRDPTTQETQAAIQEAVRRNESQSQWVSRIQRDYPDPKVAAEDARQRKQRDDAASMVANGRLPNGQPLPSLSLPPGEGNAWDGPVADLKALYPNLSDGEVWRRYTLGQYVPQKHYSTNPFTPTPYVPRTPGNSPDIKRLKNLPPPPVSTREDPVPDPYAAERAAIGQQIEDEVRIVPGAPPNIGVLRDGTPIDFTTGQPIETNTLDPVTVGYTILATRHFDKLPRYQDYKNLINLSSRGYRFKGEPSAEEQALTTRFLAGDEKAAGELAALRMKRLDFLHAPSSLHKIMKPLTLSLMAIGFTAMGGAMATPFVGAAAGGAIGSAAGAGITTTLATNGEDWKRILLAMLASGVGSYASGAVGGAAAGATGSNVVGGAAGSATSAGVRLGLTKGLGGDVNPWDLLTAAVVGALTGGLSSGLTAVNTQVGTDPGGIGDFSIPPEGIPAWLIKIAGNRTGAELTQFLQSLLPGDPSGLPSVGATGPYSPEFARRLRDDSLTQARADLEARMQEYRDRLDEYNARKAEALGKRDAAIAEFKARQDEALTRLKEQAASYLEQVQQARRRPLPPIPQSAGPAPKLPPDPFDASAGTRGQRFSAEGFPISTGTGTPAVPAPGTSSSPARPAARSDRRRLPLNIQQIQALLATRRR